jgi:hypothetical protein
LPQESVLYETLRVAAVVNKMAHDPSKSLLSTRGNNSSSISRAAASVLLVIVPDLVFPNLLLVHWSIWPLFFCCCGDYSVGAKNLCPAFSIRTGSTLDGSVGGGARQRHMHVTCGIVAKKTRVRHVSFFLCNTTHKGVGVCLTRNFYSFFHVCSSWSHIT